MKGVRMRERNGGFELTNRKGVEYRPWRMMTRVIAALFMTSLFGGSGAALAFPTNPLPSLQEAGESSGAFTFGTMRVEIVERASGFLFTFRLDDTATRVAIVDDSKGYRFSIDGGPWIQVPPDFGETPNLLEGIDSPIDPLQDPDFHSNARWWDGVRLIRGYPAVYPHPDRGFYHIIAKSDWRYWGIQLLHYQFGSDKVGSLVSLGPAGVGIAIGAVIGWVVGGPAGSAVGALAGAIVGGLLSYYYNVVFVDEAGTIWWWINRSLFTAIKNIPWWLWMCGRCVESYIASHIDYLRVGTLTANNDLGIRGP